MSSSTGVSPSPKAHAQAPQFTKHEPQGGLTRTSLHPTDPMAQFADWYAAAGDPSAGGVAHPETCTLATAALPSGRVSARIVYLKEVDGRGFVVYSNFGTSRKAGDLFGVGSGAGLAEGGGAGSASEGAGEQEGRAGHGKHLQGQGNRHAALVFWWESQERQVRVEGLAERVSREQSQAYFDTRVRGSRIGAWASQQSAVLPPDPAVAGDDGRAALDSRVRETERRFEAAGEDIPVPEFWGGLCIVPDRVEFWQGRRNRLHDRFVYERVGEDGNDGASGGEKWSLERLSP